MFLLNTTMLREKFTVTEKDGTQAMVATGNRITLPLVAKGGQLEERLVVRGQNMHTTLRMAAMVARSFYRDGPLLSRSPAYPWGPSWMDTVPQHEQNTNAHSWVAVYAAGRPVYRFGDYHPFLDIIEQCDARNRDEYDRAVSIAEDAFNIAGRGVTIDHQSTIAMVIGAMADKTRIGLVFRNPRQSATFNFTVDPRRDGFTRDVAVAEPHQCLNQAAAWLELVQLSVTAGFYRARRGAMMTDAPSLEATERRLGQLNAEITQFENSFDVHYRPERPDMMALIEEAAGHARGDYHQPIYQDPLEP